MFEYLNIAGHVSVLRGALAGEALTGAVHSLDRADLLQHQRVAEVLERSPGRDRLLYLTIELDAELVRLQAHVPSPIQLLVGEWRRDVQTDIAVLLSGGDLWSLWMVEAGRVCEYQTGKLDESGAEIEERCESLRPVLEVERKDGRQWCRIWMLCRKGTAAGQPIEFKVNPEDLRTLPRGTMMP